MSKPRSGIATILGFTTTRSGYLLTLQRANGQRAVLPLDVAVAERLAQTYGIRARDGSTLSMKALKGVACRYHETSQGLLVEVEILAD